MDQPLRHGDCGQVSTFDGLSNVDLISVMMGTFNHLSRAAAKDFLDIAFAASRPGAELVISTWAEPPNDLNIYSPVQAARLQSSNSLDVLASEIAGFWTVFQTYEVGALEVRVLRATIAGCGASG